MVVLHENTNDLIGVGIYTPGEAAFYARLPYQTVTRWMGWDSGGKGVFAPQVGHATKIVSFLDFVQTLSIRAIRQTYRIPLQKIREAVDEARERWNIGYPFAMKHRTFLFGDLLHAPQKATVILKTNDDEDDEQLVSLMGKTKGNLIFAEVAELHMEDLYWGDNVLAQSYTAWKEDDNRKIVFDPRKQFGDPMVGDTGYSAPALWHAYVTEGGVDRAAEAYDVSPEDVKLAIRYYDHLQGSSILCGRENKVPV